MGRRAEDSMSVPWGEYIAIDRSKLKTGVEKTNLGLGYKITSPARNIEKPRTKYHVPKVKYESCYYIFIYLKKFIKKNINARQTVGAKIIRRKQERIIYQSKKKKQKEEKAERRKKEKQKRSMGVDKKKNKGQRRENEQKKVERKREESKRES